MKKEPTINLHHGDCMEALKNMRENQYDLAIVDPPYGIGNWVQITGNVRGKKINWNDSIPPDEYFNQLRRASKNRIVWGANYYNSFEGSNGSIVWWKHVPRESNMSVCEIASYNRLRRVDFINLKWQNINRNEAVIHPCQKPVALYKWLLNNYAKPGDKILDTHGGSMSIAIACYDLGFDLDLWELDADYYQAGVERFENHKKQLQLF